MPTNERQLEFVAHENELQRLHEAWQSGTGAQKKTGMVLTLGQDGVGKSALLEQFGEELDQTSQLVEVLRDRWSPDEFDPFAPFLAQLGLTYIMGRLVPGVPKKAVSWAITLTLPNVPVVGDILAGEAQELLNNKPVASDPDTMERLRKQVADWITRRARNRALAFILEDLQYAGEAGVALLDYLVGALEGLPVVFFVSLRTDAQSQCTVPPDVLAHLHLSQQRTRTLCVMPLAEDSAEKLARAALTPHFKPDVLAQIVDDCVKATQGVPRRIIRLTERLAALAYLEISALQAAIREFALNNLSLLNDKESELVQLQSVLRADLPQVAFAPLAQSRYWDLSERDIRRYLPHLSDFLTEMTFDSVYEDIAPDVLESDHLHCAMLLEQAYPQEMPMSLVPVVAHHYEQAGQLDKAGRYYLQAGLAFNEQNMNGPAVEQLRKASELYTKLEDPETLAEVDYLLGWSDYKMGNCAVAKRHLENALDNYNLLPADDERIDDRRDRTRLLLGVILAHGEQRFDDAVPWLREAQDTGDGRVRALARCELAYCLFKKDPIEAELLVRSGLQEARKHDNQFTVAQALQYLGLILLNKRDDSQISEAIAALDEAAKLAEPDKYLLAQIYNTLADAYAQLGDDEQAVEEFKLSLALKIETGDTQGQAYSYGGLGRAYRRLGRHDEALDNFRRDLALISDKENLQAQVNQMLCEISDVQRLQGNLAAANTDLQNAAEVIATIESASLRQRNTAYQTLAAARVARDASELDRALDCAAQARQLFEQVGFRFMLPSADLVLSGVYRQRGQLEQAADALTQAATGRFDNYDLAWLKIEQALLARAQGDLETAANHWLAAFQLAQKLHNPWMQSLFAAWA